jgi:hypothetical protein
VSFKAASFCVAALVLASIAAPSAALETSPEVRVTTFAGSGVAGFEDGSPGSFLMPFGLTYGPDGTLYVTDAGAQRIRAVDPSGRIRTIAGSGTADATGLWVGGGYRDGPAHQAQFNRPAGIVWLDGKLYVADTNNHCVRVIGSDGTVRTFAGSPQRPGTADGPLATASLAHPTGLAKDSAGHLYVADFYGVREIHDGQVTTVPYLGSTPFGVAEVDTKSGPVLFVADLLGLERRMPDGTIERYATDASKTATRNIQGLQPLGFPFSIAAFDPLSVVYGDVRGNSVRYLNWEVGSEQILAGVDVYDGVATSAGFKDGSGDQTRVDGPTGLAIAPDGTIALADAASRRVRLIRHLDRSHDARSAEAIPNSPPAHGKEHRVAFIGNSFLWEYDRWSNSIPGIVERRLNDPRNAAFGRFVVTPYIFPGAQIIAMADYAKNSLAETHLADVIVVDIATSNLYGMPSVPANASGAQIIAAEPTWTKQLTVSLHDADEILRKSGIALVVVTNPLPDNVSPVESLWNQLIAAGGQQSSSYEIGVAMNEAVRRSGVRFVDGWSAFEAESRSHEHAALFGTQDVHFSPHGRAVLANAITDYLENTKPWQP